MSTTTVERDLRTRESSIIQELRTIRRIEEDNQQRRKSLVIEWADILERQIEAGIITLKKNEIADRMAKTIKTHGGNSSEIRYMYDCLPYDYKTSQSVKALNSDDPRTNKYVSESSKALRDEYFKAWEFIESFDTMHLTDYDQQESFFKADKVKEQQRQKCEDRHLEIIEPSSADHSWEDDLSDQFAERYSVNKPDPYVGENPDVDALDRFIKQLQTWRQKLIDYPASVEDKIRLAKAIDVLSALWDPNTDDKWRRSWRQWFKILKNRVDYSLHGAMSMSKLETSVKQCFRGVTREQIDAKMIVGFKYFGDFLDRMPGLEVIMDHYEKYQQPHLGELTTRMHDKMSFLS